MSAARPERRLSCRVIGSTRIAVHCARILLERGHRILGVAARDDVLAEWAGANALPLATGPAALPALLADEPYDLLLSIVNDVVLPAAVLRRPAVAAVNYHGALLPDLAGVNPCAWAICLRRATHGVTWHRMAERVDAGDVLAQASFAVAPRETTRSLNLKCARHACEAFGALLDGLERDAATPAPQELARRVYRGLRDTIPYGGLLDWGLPAEEIDAIVRAADHGEDENPFGLARLFIGERWFAARRTAVVPCPAATPPGTVLECAGDALTVATGRDALRVLELRDARGLAVSPADVLPPSARPGGRPLGGPAPAALDAWRSGVGRALRAEPSLVASLSAAAPPSLRELALPGGADGGAVAVPGRSVPGAAGGGAPAALAALAADLGAFLTRVLEEREFDLGVDAGADPAAGASGLFARTLPLRIAPGRECSVADARDAIARQCGERLAAGPALSDLHARYPRLTPFVPSVLLSACPEPGGAPAGAADLLVALTGAEGSRWSSPSGRLAGTDLQRLAGQFLRFRDAADAGAQTPLARLGFLSAEELAFQGLAPSPAPCAGLADLPVHELFLAAASRAPEHTAVESDAAVLSYAQLADAAAAVAGTLIDRGVACGDVVAIALGPGAEAVVAGLGTLLSGAAFLFLDVDSPLERQARILRDAGAAALIAGAAARVPPLPPGCRLVSGGLLERAGGPRPLRKRAVPLSSPAYVIYTSGSTGSPLGVRVSHGALSRFLQRDIRRLELDSRDRILQLCRPTFDASIEEIYSALACGATVCIPPAATRGAMDALLDYGERARLTVIGMFPHQIPAAEEALHTRGACPPTLRLITTGAEAVPAAPVRRWNAFFREHDVRPPRFLNVYGLTETTIASTVYDMTESPGAGDVVPIGKPLEGNRVYILDEAGQPVPAGATGQIAVGGDELAEGYLGQPEITRARYVPDPFCGAPGGRMFLTGDRARFLPDGNIEFLGRKDRQTSVRGRRVDLTELEAALVALPGVQWACAVHDRPGSPASRLIAYVVLAASADPAARIPDVAPPLEAQAARRLVVALAERFPRHMVPAAFYSLPRPPTTRGGKADVRNLPQPENARAEAAASAAAADPEQTRKLGAIWSAALRVPAVAPHQRFFDLGGDSISCTAVLAGVEAEFGVRLELAEVLVNPSLQEMAARIASGGPAALQQVVTLQPHGLPPALCCLPDLFGSVGTYFPLAAALAPHVPVYALVAESELVARPEDSYQSIQALALHLLPVLRRHQPEGPYALLGYSWGGMLAFEMACLLQDEGCPVSFLGLVGTSLPDVPIPRAEKLLHFLRHLGPWAVGFLRDGGQAARVRAMWRRHGGAAPRDRRAAGQAGDPPPEPAGPSPAQILVRHHRRLADEYRPRRGYTGPVILYQHGNLPPPACHPLHPPLNSARPDFGWGRVTASVEVVCLPGAHLTAMDEPHVSLLARELRAALARPPSAAKDQ